MQVYDGLLVADSLMSVVAVFPNIMVPTDLS